jgi:hypothetical protein
MKISRRLIGLIGLPISSAALAQVGPVPTGFSHVQTNQNFVRFEAEQPFNSVDINTNRGWRTAAPNFVGNSSGTAVYAINTGGNPSGSRLEYRITFSTPGTYSLFLKNGLNALGGQNPDLALSYDNYNSIWLPRALGENPTIPGGQTTGSLDDRRKNLFTNTQWPFPHNGNYEWTTTETILYHNYSVFPAHDIVVGPADVGTPRTLIISAREPGWGIDRLALVRREGQGAWGDDAYHPQFDGTFLDQQYFHSMVTIGTVGDPRLYQTQVPAYDWTGDGVIDAVRAHPVHFGGGWRGTNVWSLDLAAPGFPLGDTHPDTNVNVNGRIFETHFAGNDPDGGVTPLYLNSLFATPGDANFSGMVDFADLLLVAQSYGSTTGSDWTEGDFDYDSAVGFGDLLILAQNYSGPAVMTGTYGAFDRDWARALAMVPEPAGLMGLTIAAGMFVGRRR